MDHVQFMNNTSQPCYNKAYVTHYAFSLDAWVSTSTGLTI